MPAAPSALSEDTATAKVARANWARFIKKILEVDPLLCPDCGGIMRIISFIEDQRVVRAILVHQSLRDLPKPRPPPVGAGADADYEFVPCED